MRHLVLALRESGTPADTYAADAFEERQNERQVDERARVAREREEQSAWLRPCTS